MTPQPTPAAPLSPMKQAEIESRARIQASRDKLLAALADLHPEEQLEAAQALVSALQTLNTRVLKQRQLAKLREELGEA